MERRGGQDHPARIYGVSSSTMRSRAFLCRFVSVHRTGTILTRGNDLPGFAAAPEGKFNNRESGVEKKDLGGGDNCFREYRWREMDELFFEISIYYR